MGQISYEKGNYYTLSRAWCHFVIYSNLKAEEPFSLIHSKIISSGMEIFLNKMQTLFYPFQL